MKNPSIAAVSASRARHGGCSFLIPNDFGFLPQPRICHTAEPGPARLLVADRAFPVRPQRGVPCRGVTRPPRQRPGQAEWSIMTRAGHRPSLAGSCAPRREGVRPQDAGLPPGTGSRRTPGLRREEIATLAGVSIDYYTRLERGRETRPSPAVVDALARTLRLDGDEHEYLKSLAAQAARRAPVPPKPPSRTVRPTARLLLETPAPEPGLRGQPHLRHPRRQPRRRAAAPWPARLAARQRNTIRYTFLHPAARDLWPDWEQKARGCVAQLRAIAGSDPDAPDLAALVGELLVKSPDFGRLWGRYEVRRAGAGDRVMSTRSSARSARPRDRST